MKIDDVAARREQVVAEVKELQHERRMLENVLREVANDDGAAYGAGMCYTLVEVANRKYDARSIVKDIADNLGMSLPDVVGVVCKVDAKAMLALLDERLSAEVAAVAAKQLEKHVAVNWSTRFHAAKVKV